MRDIFVLGSDGKVYSLFKAIYLLKEQKLNYIIYRGKEVTYDDILNILKNEDPKMYFYCRVFEYLMDHEYFVGAGLKFGSLFRVYDRGEKPEKGIHSRWICYPVTEKILMHELASKMRVAHSTKKTLLLCILDEKNGLNFVEVKWARL